MIAITVNGEPRRSHARTVAALVVEMELPAPLLLVEHNGVALRKSEWQDAILRDGDRIEILRVSSGG